MSKLLFADHFMSSTSEKRFALSTVLSPHLEPIQASPTDDAGQRCPFPLKTDRLEAKYVPTVVLKSQ